MTDAKFGCQLPQNTTDIDYILAVAKECESLGYDSVWVYDHLAPYWIKSHSSLESWTLLSAVSMHTSKIKIGTLVTNTNLRNPALLAKMASTLDSISGGRLILGLGVGDRMSIDELQSYGFRFPPLQDRITLLRETIIALRGLWTGDETTFQGKALNISNAVCRPKPKQNPGPAIWVGGKHARVLQVTAELADGWNCWGIAQQELEKKRRYLVAACARLHRDPCTLTMSWTGTLSTSGVGNLTERMKSELLSQAGGETEYFIASFTDAAGHEAYNSFAEAVRSLGSPVK
jgi:alkanesulfonate monooxygenase SsuD/methylene tetrahydromethanopterin reductase-like flavin-dependent oxidoreductase (luciferase family)